MRESGPRAPDFSLLAAGSGRRVELRGEKGRRTGRSAVVVVVDRDSRVALSYRGERPVEPVLEAIAGHR